MGTQTKQEKHKFRKTVDSWIEKFNKRDPIFIGFFIALIVFIVLGILDLFVPNPTDLNGVLTEAHGMLMDIVIFGIVITLFNEKRSRDNKIRNYHEQLEDYKFWASEEGVLRKVGILRRLNEMKAPLPNLKGTYLSGAHFPEANLRETCFEMAQFKSAFLPNANFESSDLLGAKFQNANLLSANFQTSNLRAATLNKAQLLKTNLNGSNLMQAQLRMAKLSEANLNGANLYLADLEGADLKHTDLRMADLREAKMNWVATSTGRRNTCVKSLSWCFKI